MKDVLEWIQTRQRREQREGEMSLRERQRRARQRLECVELAPLFEGTAVVGGDAKAPASRTHSKRFAELGDIWHIAPGFGVRGACSRFLKGQQRSWAMPKRRQAGRTPNASRNPRPVRLSRCLAAICRLDDESSLMDDNAA